MYDDEEPDNTCPVCGNHRAYLTHYRGKRMCTECVYDWQEQIADARKEEDAFDEFLNKEI